MSLPKAAKLFGLQNSVKTNDNNNNHNNNSNNINNNNNINRMILVDNDCKNNHKVIAIFERVNQLKNYDWKKKKKKKKKKKQKFPGANEIWTDAWKTVDKLPLSTVRNQYITCINTKY